MGESRGHDRWRRALLAVLAVALLTGVGVLLWQHAGRGGAIEILPARPAAQIQVSISGGSGEGFYLFTPESTLRDLLGAAGAMPGSGASTIVLAVSLDAPGEDGPQRVNLNTADAWLLEALPGIGAVRAQSIIADRSAAGPFRSVDELARVDGIGPATIAGLRDKVTVV